MNLSDSEVAEFKKLVKDEFGIELSDDDAQLQAEEFIQLMYPLFRHSCSPSP